MDFGLPDEIVNQANGDVELITREVVFRLLPHIKRNRHKYEAGYAIGLAGSLSMPGAAILSSLAAFRGGSGVVRLLFPHGMEAELSASPPELIKIGYAYDRPDEVVQLMQKADAAFIGPGLSRSLQIENFLHAVIPQLDIPCVIDADALTLFADRCYKLPKHVIFTPHTGEMQRLLQSQDKLILNSDLLRICQKYADDHQLTLILKGAPTFIFHAGKPILVNATGDPGMATAGSGDVLTGLLASFLSQGLTTYDAAAVGVFLHGLAGEIAAHERGTSMGLMAGDIIRNLDHALQDVL